MKIILKTQLLTKKYGGFVAVDNLSIEVPKGAVFGLLGPNGSGKTTFLGMILGIIRSTSGNFVWGDGDENYDAGRIGALLEEPNLMPNLTAMDHLKMSATIKGVDLGECVSVLERVGLKQVAHKKTRKFSLGMRQRLAIGSALLGNPNVLVLDEPLNGLDPAGISEVRDLIRTLAGEGVTIIISSHMLDEIEKVCTHLAFIKQGKLIDTQMLEEIHNGTDSTRFQIQSGADPAVMLEKLRSWAFFKDAQIEESFLHIEVQSPGDAAALNAYLHDSGVTLSHLVPIKDGVEKIFLDKTK